ncbi:MAG: tRNA uridine-5-carboxymethylaminomethyl(34) synthesis GTPase MnmE [Gemmatales bacterium]|nr:tRNA uridine-5-carboxymethylaminomethyl(34) synthesis GTPase MnmE [Gemmatales bacterium]MDW7994850.1 tRNA uridine-5-carboxymethylaminomethyl(34) synthesis GTPase MnmE [Gemmatales bacterium]
MQGVARFQVDDTIAAVSSAVAPAVRAIIRLSGPNAWGVLRALLPDDAPEKPQHRAVYDTELRHVASLPAIPVMVVVFLGPRSYTGQDLVELHLPGSPPIVQAVLATLLSHGARLAGPGEFTLRAFLAGKIDLTRAEALLAVLHARHPDSLQEALGQFAGNLASPLVRVKERLLDLLAELEASLDFPEEDLTFALREALVEQCRQACEELRHILKRIEERGLLREGFRVVLTGRPNAGKSSLFNALLRTDAALVSPVAGTTRDYLTATVSLNGTLIELVDTAGIETVGPDQPSSSDAPETQTITAQAQAFRLEQVRRAPLVCYCIPANEPVNQEDITSIRSLDPQRTLLVWTKCDLLPDPDQLLAHGDDYLDGLPRIVTSAVTRRGLAELEHYLAERARSHADADPLAVSLGRCQHHVRSAVEALEQAEALLIHQESTEFIALEVRAALEELGAVLGEIYTDDLLDRIFSRFCIGK